MTYLWIVWFEIAVERDVAARKARAASGVRTLGEKYLTAQDDELRASMVGVSAAAHAIDAFYGSVAYEIDLPDELAAAWERNRSPRRARILETLKQGFAIGPKVEGWAEELRWLFDLRDGAVHHEARPMEMVTHPSGRALVPRENLSYSCEAATRAVELALDVITSCLRTPKPSQVDVHGWASREEFRAKQLEGIRDPDGILGKTPSNGE